MTTKLLVPFSAALAMAAAAVLSWGCRSSYQPKVKPDLAIPAKAELGRIAGKKFHVPVRIIVNAPDDMVGQNSSLWDGTPFGYKDLFHYPLRRLTQDCFNNVFYTVFDQPGGEVIDSFELQVEPQISELTVRGDERAYKLVMYVTFSEPGGKRLVSFQLDKANRESSTIPPEQEVPSVVYNTLKELAVESIQKICDSQASRKAISRFEEK